MCALLTWRARGRAAGPLGVGERERLSWEGEGEREKRMEGLGEGKGSISQIHCAQSSHKVAQVVVVQVLRGFCPVCAHMLGLYGLLHTGIRGIFREVRTYWKRKGREWGERGRDRWRFWRGGGDPSYTYIAPNPAKKSHR